MGRRSSITSLPGEIRKAVDEAIANEWTIDQIVAKIRELGAAASRSAVGRYRKSIEEVGEKLRRSRAIADALVKEIGPDAAEGKTGRLLVELLQNVAFKVVMAEVEGDEPGIGAKDLHFFARALKDMAAASKIDLDREMKIREAVKAELAEKAKHAAADAKKTLGKAGLSEQTIRAVEEQILGIVR